MFSQILNENALLAYHFITRKVIIISFPLLDILCNTYDITITDIVFMKVFYYFIRIKLKGLLIEPTSDVFIQALRAFFVGGIAFVADASTLWLLSLTGIHYLICAGLGFVIGVFVNYILSIHFVFREKAALGKTGEIAAYLLISLIGLGLTELMMWFFTEIAKLYFMFSKCIAALIAFTWNFTSRKILLYRKVENR